MMIESLAPLARIFALTQESGKEVRYDMSPS